MNINIEFALTMAFFAVLALLFASAAFERRTPLTRLDAQQEMLDSVLGAAKTAVLAVGTLILILFILAVK